MELGEIEFALRQHALVREAVVIAREDIAPGKTLVAYWVAAETPPPAATGIAQLFSDGACRFTWVPLAFVSFGVAAANAQWLSWTGVLSAAPDDARQEQVELRWRPGRLGNAASANLGEGVESSPCRHKGQFQSGRALAVGGPVIAQIEERMGKKLPVAALSTLPRSSSWPGCAHDGGVLFWRDLARHLGADQPFYALQAQGLDGRRPPHDRIEEMAAHYIEEIRSLQPEGPYFIGGHCIGGLIAFEMAQQLHRKGERVGLLALFDSYAPRRGRARSSLFYRYRYKTIRLFEMTVGLHVNNLLIIEPKERLSYLREKFNKALYKLYMGLGSAWIPAARQRRNILRAGSQAFPKL